MANNTNNDATLPIRPAAMRAMTVAYVLSGGRPGVPLDAFALQLLSNDAIAMPDKTFERTWGALASGIMARKRAES
jgi:hypothetical protein